MTQEQKELLLKDLCARLSYGVKAYIKNWSKLDRKYYRGLIPMGLANDATGLNIY